ALIYFRSPGPFDLESQRHPLEQLDLRPRGVERGELRVVPTGGLQRFPGRGGAQPGNRYADHLIDERACLVPRPAERDESVQVGERRAEGAAVKLVQRR